MPLRVPKETLKKIQPKLRMIADVDSVVNVIRAERCGALAVENKRLLRDVVPSRGAVSDKPDAAAHMKLVADVVAQLERNSRGKMTSKFLTTGSSLKIR